MSGGSQPAGNTTSTQTSEPWSGVAPYLEDAYRQADRLGGRPLEIRGPVDFHRYENEGRQDLRGIGRQGIPAAVQDATGTLRDTLQGDYLRPVERPYESALGQIRGVIGGNQRDQTADLYRDARHGLRDTAQGDYLRASNNPFLSGDINPYAEQLYGAASRPVIESFNEQTLPALTAQFAQAGQTGSPQQQAVQVDAASDLQRNLADMSSGIYGQLYESERDRAQRAFEGERGRMQGAQQYGAGLHQGNLDRQLHASGLAGQLFGDERDQMARALALSPQLGTLERDLGISNAQLIQQFGQQEREMKEARNAAAEARSREPWERLNMQSQIYGAGSPFMSTTSAQPYYRNRGASALGSGMAGAGLGAMVGGPIGAGVGGLSGLVLGGLL